MKDNKENSKSETRRKPVKPKLRCQDDVEGDMRRMGIKRWRGKALTR
jgi:hypothetical protein